MQSDQASENPYASPRGFEVQPDADSLLKRATRLYRRMGWIGIVYALIVCPLVIIGEFTEDRAVVGFFVGMTIWCGLALAFFRAMTKTAEHLAVDFDRYYRRARWIGILAAVLVFPWLTIPVLLAVRRLERYREFVKGRTTEPLDPEEETQ